VAAGAEHSLALQTGGMVVAWGDDTYGQIDVPVAATNIIALCAGDLHNVALVRTTEAAGPLQFELVSQPGDNPTSFHLRLHGLTGQGVVVIYASSDLVNWVPIFTNPPTLGPVDYSEVKPSNSQQQFYRASEAR
jgi:hypothetical protein